MKKLPLIGIITAIALLAAGCAAAAGGESPALDNTSWTLSEINGEAPLEGSTITAEFAEGQVNGSGGCNSYSGTYELARNTLNFGPITTTEMYCMDPEGVTEQESTYHQILGQTQTASIENGKLTLVGADGATLVFNPAG